MKTYRVFVTRHYIDCKFFDIEADSQRDAEVAAEKAAKKLYPDVRDVATDNGWIADTGVETKGLGISAAPFDVELVYEDKKAKVYQGVSGE